MSLPLLESRRRSKAGINFRSAGPGSNRFYDCRLDRRLASKLRRIGTQLTTFRINTCKSVSKQRTLTPFRMNTCEKRGEGGHVECGSLAAACAEYSLAEHVA